MSKNLILIYSHMKLCLATATHNFKWVFVILDQTFANIDV